MRKRLIAVLVCASILLILLPSTALAYNYGSVTYNDNDYGKLKAFLELPSADGVHTNGWQLDSGYSPDNPGTWTGVNWTGPMNNLQVQSIDFNGKSLAGSCDVSGFTAMTRLDCSGNQISSLSLTGCTTLQRLFCDDNNLNELDLTGLTALIDLECGDNNLTTLDISDNPLMILDCNGNAISGLDVSGKVGLQSLYCADNGITSLDLSHNVQLSYLDCAGNALTGLDLSANTVLNILKCSNNDIAEITLNSSILFVLECKENELTSLNVSSIPFLNTLDCTGNLLASVYATIQGKEVKLTASGEGYVSLYWGGSEFYAQAVPKTGAAFYDWTDVSDAEASTAAKYDLTPGDAYDLTGNFLSLAASPSDGKIYTGGRITLTPSIAGGDWSFDGAYLSRSGNRFTGLKAGTVRVTYSLSGVSTYFDVAVEASQLPSTGQNFTWLWVCGVAASIPLIAALLFRKRAARG